ncbi:MAG: cytochrome c [Solirubrobacteraceae bacterium]|mgnify:CR=1 FL=1|nr:cytochrome c [Solirubrobacteraceae bacterium]
MHRWLRRLTALVAVAALAALVGCGGDDGDASTATGGATAPATAPATTGGADTGAGGGGAEAEGARVFADAGCGNCHTLAAADASGRVGPDLDELTPSVDQVRRMVTNGGGGMPAFDGQLSPEEIDAVAEYVASVAGGS